MDRTLELIRRSHPLFQDDLGRHSKVVDDWVRQHRFLVLGGAGTIGQAVVKELFKRSPKMLHVVDISENNLVELVRDIRSSLGYIQGDFRLFALDIASRYFDAFIQSVSEPYDYILNLSALKHVRSEKDPFTLMRMIEVNIFNTLKTIQAAQSIGSKKYFCVSTDKATNPVNMMGASKRIMELFLLNRSIHIPVSTARFANVAFSDGSLLYGFQQRIQKNQPISAPNDVRRYFITPEEAGILCLLSCALGENRETFFPKLSDELKLTKFSEIAQTFLLSMGLEPVECATEDEARQRVHEFSKQKKWPCYFFKSDTTGEKDFEEFFTDTDTLDLQRFTHVGIIKNPPYLDHVALDRFTFAIQAILQQKTWSKEALVSIFEDILPELDHEEKGKFLDNRM